MTKWEVAVVVLILGAIGGVVMPELVAAKAAANESVAIASLREVTDAETAFSRACGAGAYAVAFATLGQTPSSGAMPLLRREISEAPTPLVSGYSLSIGPSREARDGLPDCNGNVTATGYYVRASPQTFGVSGVRSFAASEAGVIWETPARSAPTQPFGPPATPVQRPASSPAL